jgi:hypothetical protein
MKKLIASLAICAALAACGTAPPKPELAPIATPADLTRQCPDLQHIDSQATLGTAMTYITDLQKQYTVCATRNDSLREVTTPVQQTSTSQGK